LAVSATVFEILTLKLENPTPPFFEAPAGGTQLEFDDEIWHQETRIMGLPEGEEIRTLAFFVLTQYRLMTDKRTDGWTDGHVAVADPR